MPATTIHFVRHGEVFNPEHILYERLPGFHLSARGMRMAQATGRYLAANPATKTISAIYSSPLERAQETAQAISTELSRNPGSQQRSTLEIQLDQRLIEAGNEFRGKPVGRGEGALWKDGNWKLMTNLMKPSWGESYRSIAHRMRDFAYEQVERYPDQQILVVSHESPIWSFRQLLEKGRPEHNMLRRATALASVTSITFDCASKQLLGVAYADPAFKIL